jgi:hypothetical protein
MASGLGPNFDCAQRAYDAREPEDDHNCEIDGHRWRLARVAEVKGDTVTEWKCRECGATKVE